jgi:redox-sensitive bicupin YhaK (pirin superfamily)
MMTIRKAGDRGTTGIGWLDSKHTFSFGDYSDPRHDHFRTLRVINDDRIAAGGGFGTHPHRDMEIFTWVLSGSLEHRDSMGTGSTIRAGEWQAMSAGTGVSHSEFNPSETEPVRLLQMWVFPERRGLTPAYQQRAFAPPPGTWATTLSPDGRDGSMVIHQDAVVRTASLTDTPLTHELADGRGAWLQVATGTATVNGHALTEGDAVAIEGEPSVTLTGTGQVVLFDLA